MALFYSVVLALINLDMVLHLELPQDIRPVLRRDHLPHQALLDMEDMEVLLAHLLARLDMDHLPALLPVLLRIRLGMDPILVPLLRLALRLALRHQDPNMANRLLLKIELLMFLLLSHQVEDMHPVMHHHQVLLEAHPEAELEGKSCFCCSSIYSYSPYEGTTHLRDLLQDHPQAKATANLIRVMARADIQSHLVCLPSLRYS
jgi:hypothetical protein